MLSFVRTSATFHNIAKIATLCAITCFGKTNLATSKIFTAIKSGFCLKTVPRYYLRNWQVAKEATMFLGIQKAAEDKAVLMAIDQSSFQAICSY